MCGARLRMGGGESKGCQVCEPNGFAPFDFAQGFFSSFLLTYFITQYCVFLVLALVARAMGGAHTEFSHISSDRSCHGSSMC